MIARQIAPRPHCLPGGSIQAGSSGTAKVHIDPACFDGGGRRGVAVEGMAERGVGHVEDLDIVDDLASIAMHAQGKEFLAVRSRRGQPDLVAPDHRRRPALAVNGRLPANVLCLAPMERQTGGLGVTVSCRPAILWPVVPSFDTTERQ